MRRDVITSLLAIVIFTVVFGLAYPLVTTGVSQVLFPNKSDGSQIKRDGKIVGSRLIGQDFQKPVLDKNGKPKVDKDGNPVLQADPRYFQSRPSATGYSADATFFNNLGPNSKELSGEFTPRVRTADPEALRADLLRLVNRIDPRITWTSIRRGDMRFEDEAREMAFAVYTVGAAGTVALALSATGLYAVLSYIVALRRREIGVRLAIGAPPSHIIALVIRQALTLVVAGMSSQSVHVSAVVGVVVWGRHGISYSCMKQP